MEAAIKPKRSYRKRKQRPLNPLTGVVTRNKSRRYLHHCTRSGKIRPDPLGKSQLPSITSATPRLDSSVSIKDLRAHRVFSKPVVAVNDANHNFDCDLGEIQNPNFDSILGENENPNLSLLVKSDLDVEVLIEQTANLLNVQNPNFNCELGKMENPNLSVSIKCDLDVEFKDNEGMIDQNPYLSSVQNPNFLEKFGLEVEGLNVRNPNLLEKCDSVVDLKDDGLDGRNPSLLENFDLEIGCEKKGLDEEDPDFLEKCDSIVDSKDEGLDGQNHSLLEKEVDCKVEGLNERSPNLLGKCDSVEDGGEEKFGVGLACNGSVPDDMSPNLSDKDLKGRKCEDFEGLVEINVQTTPPDVVMSLRPIEDCNVVATGNVASSSPQNRGSPSKDGSAEGKKTNSILKKTSVLKPCSRPRVFKAPNSFSYRRLLPYLMDLAKDTSSPLKLDDHPKSENSDIVKSVVSKSRDRLSGSHESDEKQVTTVPVSEILEVSNGTNSKEEKELSLDSRLNASSLHVFTQIHMDQSHDDGQAYSVSNENQNVTHVSNGSPEGGASNDDEQISSDNHEKLEDAKSVNESHTVDMCPKAPQEMAIVEDVCHLSLHSAEECRALQVYCKTKENSISVFHKSSNVEGFVSSSGPIVCPVKGILKKNPRGCRGICDCLNCALFRLNAEKSFEFSRNQLLNTQELVQDMMKEMASLRFLLEKSANGAESIACIPVNQVQEACSRVSEVEAIARTCLSQMNEDLYVHCRNKPLQRPRVNF